MDIYANDTGRVVSGRPDENQFLVSKKSEQKQDLRFSRFCARHDTQRGFQTCYIIVIIIIRKTANDKFQLQMLTDRAVCYNFELEHPDHCFDIKGTMRAHSSSVSHYSFVDRVRYRTRVAGLLPKTNNTPPFPPVFFSPIIDTPYHITRIISVRHCQRTLQPFLAQRPIRYNYVTNETKVLYLFFFFCLERGQDFSRTTRTRIFNTTMLREDVNIPRFVASRASRKLITTSFMNVSIVQRTERFNDMIKILKTRLNSPSSFLGIQQDIFPQFFNCIPFLREFLLYLHFCFKISSVDFDGILRGVPKMWGISIKKIFKYTLKIVIRSSITISVHWTEYTYESLNSAVT